MVHNVFRLCAAAVTDLVYIPLSADREHSVFSVSDERVSLVDEERGHVGEVLMQTFLLPQLHMRHFYM